MTNQGNPSTSTVDSIEPKANWRSVPVWLLVLVLVLLYWGMIYFDLHGGWFSSQVYPPFRSDAEVAAYQPPVGPIDLVRGKTVYENVCALCHGNDGAGKPNQAPPLANSEWVTGAPSRLIRIPLYGLTGPITVNGQQMVFPAGMLAMGAALSDEDMAAVLSYMRQAWGNKASLIMPEKVKEVRSQVGNRPQQFTPEEIMQVPE